jgi:hypothetical protein
VSLTSNLYANAPTTNGMATMYTKEMVAVLRVQRNAPGLLLLMSIPICQSDILSAETVRQWGCCRGGSWCWNRGGKHTGPLGQSRVYWWSCKVVSDQSVYTLLYTVWYEPCAIVCVFMWLSFYEESWAEARCSVMMLRLPTAKRALVSACPTPAPPHPAARFAVSMDAC